MNRLLTAVVAAATLAGTAAPALAHDYAPHRGGWQNAAVNTSAIRRDIYDLRSDIERALDSRRIGAREAQQLRRSAASVHNLYGRWSRDGLDRGEAREIRRRIDDVRSHLRYERRDRDRTPY